MSRTIYVHLEPKFCDCELTGTKYSTNVTSARITLDIITLVKCKLTFSLDLCIVKKLKSEANSPSPP